MQSVLNFESQSGNAARLVMAGRQGHRVDVQEINILRAEVATLGPDGWQNALACLRAVARACPQNVKMRYALQTVVKVQVLTELVVPTPAQALSLPRKAGELSTRYGVRPDIALQAISIWATVLQVPLPPLPLSAPAWAFSGAVVPKLIPYLTDPDYALLYKESPYCQAFLLDVTGGQELLAAYALSAAVACGIPTRFLETAHVGEADRVAARDQMERLFPFAQEVNEWAVASWLELTKTLHTALAKRLDAYVVGDDGDALLALARTYPLCVHGFQTTVGRPS